jgi:hypothetical protein
MDTNYNWNNATFSGRCGQSLNLAVNDVADVLHTLYQEASPTPTATPTSTPTPSPTPTSNPTTAQSTTPTLPPPINTPVPTDSITPKPSLTPIPSPTQNPTSTPTIPEFPTAQLLTVAMLTVTAAALAYKKTALKK